MKNFEMANSDNPTEIIKATQRSIIKAIQDLVEGLKKDVGGPGLTWEQIAYLLDGFAKKEPMIITQEFES